MLIDVGISERRGRDNERRRCVGLVLRLVGELQLFGYLESAEKLDALATEMEHPLDEDDGPDYDEDDAA